MTQPVSCGMWMSCWSHCVIFPSQPHINHNAAVQNQEACHGCTHPGRDLQNVEGWGVYSLSPREM